MIEYLCRVNFLKFKNVSFLKLVAAHHRPNRAVHHHVTSMTIMHLVIHLVMMIPLLVIMTPQWIIEVLHLIIECHYVVHLPLNIVLIEWIIMVLLIGWYHVYQW